MTTQFLFGVGEAGAFPNLTKAFTTWLPARGTCAGARHHVAERTLGRRRHAAAGDSGDRLVGWRHTFPVFGGWASSGRSCSIGGTATTRATIQAECGELALLRGERHAHPHGEVPWAKFLRSRQVWLLCVQYFCLSYGWYFYITWLPTYCGGAPFGREVGGYLRHRAAIHRRPRISAASLSRPLAPWVGNMAQTRRIMAYIGFTGASMFLLLSTQMNDPRMAMLCIGLASFSNDLVMPGAWAACMDVGGKQAGRSPG